VLSSITSLIIRSENLPCYSIKIYGSLVGDKPSLFECDYAKTWYPSNAHKVCTPSIFSPMFLR
jgi:hypothetical protein